MLKKGLVIIVFFTSIISCKSAKVKHRKIANLSSKSVIRKNIKTHFDNKSIKANLGVKYSGKSNLPSLRASLRMVKDSVIWLSFSKLGFPVAKLMISQNRVRFYEKITETYFDGDFKLISKSLGTDFDFQKVQNLFLGEPLLNLKNDKYIIDREQDLYKLHKKEEASIDFAFWINPYNFRLVKEQIQHLQNNQFLTVLYKEFVQIDKTFFPKGFKIKAVDKKRKTDINVNYKNVIFDKNLKFPFKIPKTYKKIELK